MNRDEALLTARADAYLDSLHPNFELVEDVEVCVANDLAKPIAELMQCRGASVEAYEEALGKLERALYARYRDA